MPERCRSDDVSTVDAGACTFDVFACIARRDGDGKRGLGSAGDKNRCPEYNALFRDRVDAGAGDGAVLSAYSERNRAGTSCGKGLICGSLRARGILRKLCG